MWRQPRVLHERPEGSVRPRLLAVGAFVCTVSQGSPPRRFGLFVIGASWEANRGQRKRGGETPTARAKRGQKTDISVTGGRGPGGGSACEGGCGGEADTREEA